MSFRAWDSAVAARSFDQRSAEHLNVLELPSPHEYFRQIKWYLQRMTDKGRVARCASLLKQKTTEQGEAQIDAGPTIYRSSEACIRFSSGAELSFGITLRNELERSKLVAYRFHLELPPDSGLKFVRIDLNGPQNLYDPLQIPRSHIHPGFPHIHVPFPVMSPLEVLDRLFHVIEPHFAR